MRPGPTRRALAGLAAGLVGGLSILVVAAALRWLFGIPLIGELISDRVIPELSIGQFSRLARALGGLEHAKETALFAGLLAPVVIAAAAGTVFALTLGTRPVASRRGAIVLSSSLAAAALLFVVLLWPVMPSNYRGLPPGLASFLNVLAIVATFAIWGAVFVASIGAFDSSRPDRPKVRPTASEGRAFDRRTAITGGVAVLLALLGARLVQILTGRATVGANGYDGLTVHGPQTASITPNDRFYVVTKNLIDPNVAGHLWRLRVTGSVHNPFELGYAELISRPSSTQTQTLECISNGVGGGLMSNAVWRGVPLGQLIAEARPLPDARFVLLHASDGYTDGLSLDLATHPTTLVAYEMNGETLPDRHGYPARVLVPGTYGEVNVKWVDQVELLDASRAGYYERQGWRPERVQTTSRFDRPVSGQTVSLAAQPGVPVGGVAFAGDRGISKVEVSFDGGASWAQAALGYQPNSMTWALWSLTWNPSLPGTYTLLVRATDGRGQTQTAARHGTAPSGASGYHRVVVDVRP
ncbi:MAG TPA: molybdopterin-dependent oxidoreductase [Actinomycetota bacterium]